MSNLLEKASILTTPTAYNNGKILSVKPAKPYSDEITVNGNFDTDSDWTKDAGWTISNGEAIHTGSGSYISQTGTTIGKNYKVVIEVTQASGSGFPQIYMGGLTTAMTSVGTYTFDITATSTLIRLRGVNDCKVTSISVKEVLHADFDFTRNSSATRVNSQGLVEDVQILSSNLVSNGDFSQEGSELVTNGDFATDSDWFKDANWTIANGKATSTGVGRMFQSIPFLETNIGTTVQVSFDIIDITANGVVVNCYGGVSQLFTTVGTHTFTTTTINNTNLYFNNAGAGNLIGSIDNVSVKEVGQDWTLGTGWSIGANKAIATDAAFGAQIVDDTTLVANKKYKVTFDISDYVKGNVRVGVGNAFSSEVSSNGSFTFIITSSNTNAFKAQTRAGGSGTTLSISNISVIEITEDTNLPRIDYTGGVGSWLFEPQSTNLVTYSEVYGSGTYFSSFQGSTFDNITSLSPSGENNATQLTSTGDGKLQTAGISLSQNTDYTLSFYAKNVDATAVTSRVLGLGGSGGSNLTPISYFSELSTTEWKRITHSFNTGTNTTFYLYLSNALNSGGTIQIWGAQLEQSSFATSYIPTNGSTVTRLQDAAFGAGSSDLINSTEGVLYAEIATLANFGTRAITLSSGSNNDAVLISFNSNGRLDVNLTSGGSFQAIFNYTGVTNPNTFNKIAFKYKQDDFSLFVNGVKVATDTSGLTPIGLNVLNFAKANSAQDEFFGKTKCVAVFKETLTDEELTCLTTI